MATGVKSGAPLVVASNADAGPAPKAAKVERAGRTKKVAARPQRGNPCAAETGYVYVPSASPAYQERLATAKFLTQWLTQSGVTPETLNERFPGARIYAFRMPPEGETRPRIGLFVPPKVKVEFPDDALAAPGAEPTPEQVAKLKAHEAQERAANEANKAHRNEAVAWIKERLGPQADAHVRFETASCCRSIVPPRPTPS